MRLRTTRKRERLVLGGIYLISDRSITGWAGDAYSTDPVTVELVLDGTVINRTAATQDVGAPDLNGGRCGWRFGMRDIWQRISKDQLLEVRVQDGPTLKTRRGRQRLRIRGPEPQPGEALLDLLTEDYVIDKFGRVILPAGSRTDWQQRVDTEFSRLRTELEAAFGYTPFLTYGLLLGYARERAPITADHDCDITYLSDETTPESVRTEFAKIAEHLGAVDNNWTVHPYKIVWHRRFSITPSWIGPDGLRMTFAYVNDDLVVTRNDIFPLKAVQMDSMRLLVPRRAEKVAELIYGPGWRWPDSGWIWRGKWKTRPEQKSARLDRGTVVRLNANKPSRDTSCRG